jgi:hypothetical protein
VPRNESRATEAPDTWSARALPKSPRAADAPVRLVSPALVDLPSRTVEAARSEAAGLAVWQGSPDARAYGRRLALPAAAIGLCALAIGLALLWLSPGDHLFVYPLVGASSTALGAYGLLVRPLLVARAVRRVHYRIDRRGVELVWSPDRRVLIPPERVPPFSVSPPISSTAASAPAESPPLTDVLFAGPPAWASPWGAWRIVDDTWGLVGLDRPDEAIALLTQLRAVSPTPAAWAAGVVTPPRTSLFVPRLRRLLRRT